MGILGTMTVSFNANISGLSSGVANAKSLLNDFASSANNIGAEISNVFSNIFTGIDVPKIDTSGIDAGLSTVISEAAMTSEAIAGIGDAAEEATSATSPFKDGLNLISSSLQQLGSNVGGVVLGRLSNLASSIQQVGIKIGNAVSGPINNFISKVQILGSNISNAAIGPINSFVDNAQKLASIIGDTASNALSIFSTKVMNIASNIGNTVSGPINSFIDGIQNIASNINDAMSGPINDFIDGIQNIASNIINTASTAFGNFTNGIQDIASKVGNTVSGPFNRFISGVQQISSNINDAVSGPVNKFISGIKSFGADIAEAASGPLSDLIRGIKSLSSNVSDAVSGPLSSFKGWIQNTTSNIRDFASEAGNKAVSGISSFMDGVSSAASGLMDFVGGVIQGAMQLSNFAQQAIQTAGALLQPAISAETMNSAFTTLMGSAQGATDELNKLDAFASKTPFKTMDIDQAASQLIGFGINVNDVIPDLTAMGDALSAVGKGSVANLDSVVNVFGKMQTSGKLSIGVMTQLSTHGINAWQILEQQTGKTQSQLQQMIKSGMFPAKDAMDLLTKGIEKSPLYQGGMDKQSKTFAGTLSTLKSNFDQFLASVGTPVLQTLTPLFTKISDALASPGFKQFATGVGKNVLDIFKGIGDFVTPLAPKFLDIAKNVSKLGDAFKDPFFAKLAKDIGGGLKDGLTWLINALASPQFGNFMHWAGVDLVNAIKAATPVVKEIAANVVSFAKGIVTHVKPVIDWWNANWPTISQTLKGVWEIIKGVVQVGWSIIKGIIFIGLDLITGKWGQAWTDFKNLLGGAWEGIKSIFVGIYDFIVGIFTTLWDTLVGHSIIPDMINGIVNWFGQLPGRVGTFVSTLLKNLTTTLGGLGAKALGWAGDMISNFVSGIENGIGKVGDAVRKIADKIASFIHFSKPDVGPLAEIDAWMPDFADMISQGIIAGAPKVEAAMNQFSKPIALNLKASTTTSYPASASNNSAAILAAVASSSGGNSSKEIHVHVHNFIDGKELTEKGVGPHLANAIRSQGGIRSR